MLVPFPCPFVPKTLALAGRVTIARQVTQSGYNILGQGPMPGTARCDILRTVAVGWLQWDFSELRPRQICG